MSLAQHSEHINYVFPDSVEIFIDSCIRKADNREAKFYLLLTRDTVYKITIAEYNTKDEKNILKWVKQSNRCAVINNRSFPIIFDYDLKFAAIDPANIGELGKREGNIKRVSLMLHGITVSFKQDGTIIKIQNW